MASIERTAYPRFKRFMSARELHVFYTPQPDEIVWAREATSSDEHLLALVTQLQAFNRLGYFPVLNEVPAEVVGHIRRDLRLPEGTMPICASHAHGRAAPQLGPRPRRGRIRPGGCPEGRR